MRSRQCEALNSSNNAKNNSSLDGSRHKAPKVHVLEMVKIISVVADWDGSRSKGHTSIVAKTENTANRGKDDVREKRGKPQHAEQTIHATN